jgi:glycerol-3-phosphate cytidylyltransferase
MLPMTLNEKEKKLKDTVVLAHQISEKLNSEGIPVWLDLGSALGAARDGGVIKGDKDIDMAIWWKDWEKFQDILLNAPNFSRMFVFKAIKCHSGGEILCINTCPIIHEKEFNIEIWGVEEYNGIKSSMINYGSDFRSKLYYQKNLKKIKFEGLDFYVSKYVEKYLDYRYKDAGGKGKTWQTPVGQNDIESWENIPSRKGDKVVGCVIGVFDLFHVGHLRLLERSSEIFDKVVAAVHNDDTVLAYKNKVPVIPYEHRVEILKGCKFVDEVIEAPLRPQTVEWLDDNNLDYLVHAQDNPEFLKHHYSAIIEEHRLFLLEATLDYHTTDLIRTINNRKTKV